MTTDINWLELSQHTFFWQAILASVISAILCGFIGPYLAWKNLGLYGATLSHAALFPISLGLLFHFPYELALYPFLLILAITIAYYKKRRVASMDSYLAIFYSGFMALGILFTSFASGGSSEVIHYLFGEILVVNTKDLVLLGLLLVGVVGFGLYFKKALVLELVQSEIAQVEVKKIASIEYAAYILIGFVIAASLKIMGIVLLTSLLMVPTLIASRFTQKLSHHFLFSIVISVVLAITGIFIALAYDLPSGASIASLAMLSFFVTSLLPTK